MNSTDQVLLSASGSLLLIGLVWAAYLHGHHNAKIAKLEDSKNTPAAGTMEPNFVLDAIDDGVVIINSTGIIQLFNPAAARISGWGQAEAAGLDFHSVITLVDEHGQAYSSHQNPIEVALLNGQTARDDKAILTTRSGRQIPISLIVSPINDGAVGVFRDVSREKAEAKAQTDFISTASHEMRTPIAAIEGYLSLVLNNKKTNIQPDVRQLLDKAYSSTQHLGQLFADLLTTTKAEDSRLSGHPELLDLSKVISDAIEVVKSNADKKKLGLHVLTSGAASVTEKVVQPLFYVRADPLHLREVFTNLLDNAIKYTSAGSVTVKLTGDTSIAQVQISDTGIGIAPEDIPHLFQKFYRVDSTLTRQVGGTGLGLFICHQILSLYDGRIWIESTLGKGTTVFVNLPRVEAGHTTTEIAPVNPTMVQSRVSISS